MSSEIKMKMSLDSSGVKTALKTMGQKIESFAQKGYEQLNRLVKLVAVGMVGRSPLQQGRRYNTQKK